MSPSSGSVLYARKILFVEGSELRRYSPEIDRPRLVQACHHDLVFLTKHVMPKGQRRGPAPVRPIARCSAVLGPADAKSRPRSPTASGRGSRGCRALRRRVEGSEPGARSVGRSDQHEGEAVHLTAALACLTGSEARGDAELRRSRQGPGTIGWSRSLTACRSRCNFANPLHLQGEWSDPWGLDSARYPPGLTPLEQGSAGSPGGRTSPRAAVFAGLRHI